MLGQFASRSGNSQQQLLRSLLVSSHQQQQQAAAAARAFASDSGAAGSDGAQQSHVQQQEQDSLASFDAARASRPLRVHQLIGDPRTGVADDTTTAPFNNDIQVEHLWSSLTGGKFWAKQASQHKEEPVNWWRYSMAGDHLPHMYMDARLSDHSRNLMYLLRCKDPNTWTIPRLARKFRIRRQRVMSILAQKEIQAHKMTAGEAMVGPLQRFVFRVPLQDFQVGPGGEPVDLRDLVLDQQQHTPAAAAAAAAVGALDSAEGLGSLEDFLAPEARSQQSGSTAAAAGAGSSSGFTRADQQADLAVLMPQVALTAQQLQGQLLQLLQAHHYSIPELQRRLMQQIDVAEAYFKAHIQGTALEQVLLQQLGAQQQPAAGAAAASAAGEQQEAAAADGQDGAAAPAAAAMPAQLDFDQQRQVVAQLLELLQPLLAAAGSNRERETGRLLVQLQAALKQQQDGPAAASADVAGEEQQQPVGLPDVVQASDPVLLTAAFNQLSVEQRQQLVDAVPDVKITLNIQGADLRAVLSSPKGSSAVEAATTDSSSSSSLGEWPGQVPALVDVWGYQEVPRQQLMALQQALPGLQGLLQSVDELSGLTSAGSSSSGSSRISPDDIAAVQQAVQVYTGLLLQYDEVLLDQAVAATESEAARIPPPAAQRRLARILRELDPNAPKKLLLWESLLKEAAEGRHLRSLNRLRRTVSNALKALDQQAAAAGHTLCHEEYPDLPKDVPRTGREDRDVWAAELEALVVGRQFHRGSGDSNFVSVPTYPKFEGMSLEEFDKTQESEISIINRLAAERQDNVMWREFRTRLLRNMGLLAPDLAQHSGVVKPPKPAQGWSWVVHPVGGAARAQARQSLRQQAVVQWQDEDSPMHQDNVLWYQQQDLTSRQPVSDPAQGPSPAHPYVAEPGGSFRALNEEEALVVGDTQPKPRRRWFTSKG